MKTAWTAGLNAQQKEEIRSAFVANAALRQRAIEMMQKKMEGSMHKSRNSDTYENPNWAYLQADARGYERAMQEIISLFT